MIRTTPDNSERGSVLVELAMVVLPLMLILLGMVEMGGAWRDNSTAVQSSRAGARVGATSSIVQDADADRQILLSVLAGLPPTTSNGASPGLLLQRVIIYDAGTITDAELELCKNVGVGSPPAGPTAVTGAPPCNVYLAGNDLASGLPSAQQAAVSDVANYNSWTQTFTSRDQDITTAAGPTQIGVYVEMHRPWVTGIFPGDGLTISAFTVMQAEPILDP